MPCLFLFLEILKCGTCVVFFLGMFCHHESCEHVYYSGVSAIAFALFHFFKAHEKHKKLNPQDYVWGHSKPQSVYVTVYSFLGPRPRRLLRRTCPVLGFFFWKLSVSPTKQQQKTPSKCAESYSTAHDIMYIYIYTLYLYLCMCIYTFWLPKSSYRKKTRHVRVKIKKQTKTTSFIFCLNLPSRVYASTCYTYW